MFKIASKHLFWWPVTVKTPAPDRAGQFDEHTFEMQFEALPLDRAKAMDERRNALPAEERDPFDYLLEIARGWRDVTDEAGTAVAFTAETFEQQLQLPWFRDGVIAAYQQAVTGQAARLGNSDERPVH